MLLEITWIPPSHIALYWFGLISFILPTVLLLIVNCNHFGRIRNQGSRNAELIKGVSYIISPLSGLIHSYRNWCIGYLIDFVRGFDLIYCSDWLAYMSVGEWNLNFSQLVHRGTEELINHNKIERLLEFCSEIMNLMSGVVLDLILHLLCPLATQISPIISRSGKYKLQNKGKQNKIYKHPSIHPSIKLETVWFIVISISFVSLFFILLR